jgi:molybdopterin converting factor small subunit
MPSQPTGTMQSMPTIRLFASARDAAGTSRDHLQGDTVAAVLDAAVVRYGAAFEAVLRTCRIWVNGEPARPDDPIGPTDEVAILPPVSGG